MVGCRTPPTQPVSLNSQAVRQILTRIMNIHVCQTAVWCYTVLHLLHWLLVHQRVDFKVATLVHWSLSGNSASYLADDCLVADARERRLRSTESRTCVVTRTHSTFADRAFAAASPRLWNSLPPHLRDADLLYSRFFGSR